MKLTRKFIAMIFAIDVTVTGMTRLSYRGTRLVAKRQSSRYIFKRTNYYAARANSLCAWRNDR